MAHWVYVYEGMGVCVYDGMGVCMFGNVSFYIWNGIQTPYEMRVDVHIKVWAYMC